jgi:uracil-DNA glycosylase family 4
MKQSSFDDLVKRVQTCSLCERMADRKRVLSSLNGDLQSPIVFIAEAPGRLGADKFGIPLYGDQTGRNFETLITASGLSRQSVFITNSVLCNPRGQQGNNVTPRLSEIHMCARYLEETLEIVSPVYIVPLGVTALKALNIIEPHSINLSDGVGKLFCWKNYQVYPLFHPGPRAFIHRTRTQQMEDYAKLGKLLSGTQC